MTGIKDLRALVEGDEYQRRVADWAARYALNMRQESAVPMWAAACNLLKPGGIGLSELYAYWVEHGELIATMLSLRQKKQAGDHAYTHSVFLHMALQLMLLPDKSKLRAYYQAIYWPAAAQAQALAAEYQEAQVVLAGKPMAQAVTVEQVQQRVQSAEYQHLVSDLAERYALNVQPERYAAEWEIYRCMFHLGGIALADVHAYVAEHGDVIAVLLAQRQKHMGGEGHYTQCVFLSMALELMLLAEDGQRLNAYYQALKVPAAAKAVKALAAEYQNALDILHGQAAAIVQTDTPRTAAKKPARGKKAKITLGLFAAAEDDMRAATAVLWGKPTTVFVSDTDGDPPQAALRAWLEWIEAQRDEILDFALAAEDFVDQFCDWVCTELEEQGCATLADGTVLKTCPSEADIRAAVAVESVSFGVENEGIDTASLDLRTTPDYFGGHVLTIELDAERAMYFGGMNG
ncbi:hypothetical protein L1281_002453 [Neisseria sp. HSC-16F19]|nr:hypothetical protein [Neisseria sp. HSC-16F19]MCP2041835.1 hypothetical protein [Neisseria sp. HSC-16F19]